MTDEYVYDGTLVVTTGRIARKQSSQKAGRRRQIENSEPIVIEIQPADKNGIQWKKWVREDELYVVVYDDEEDDFPVPPGDE